MSKIVTGAELKVGDRINPVVNPWISFGEIVEITPPRPSAASPVSILGFERVSRNGYVYKTSMGVMPQHEFVMEEKP